MGVLDSALVEATAAAQEAARTAKAERGKAMDAVVDLLLERGEARALLRDCLPYLEAAAGRSDTRRTPSQIAAHVRAFLAEKKRG